MNAIYYPVIALVAMLVAHLALVDVYLPGGRRRQKRDATNAGQPLADRLKAVPKKMRTDAPDGETHELVIVAFFVMIGGVMAAVAVILSTWIASPVMAIAPSVVFAVFGWSMLRYLTRPPR